MRRILATAALSALVVTTLAACSFPRGPLTTEDRDIEDAHAVVLESSGDLVITPGEPALRISAPEPLMDRLTVEVRDGVLHLGVRGGFGALWGDVRYELSLPSVDSIRVEGSGDVEVDFTGAEDVLVEIEGSGDIEGTSIDADSVTTTIEGTGDVRLDGRAESVDARIDGSGDIDLDDLEAQDARAEINGVGDIRLRATSTVSAEVNGAGSIRYAGGAELIESRMNGVGDIVAY
jgi:hypothetical protein